MSERVWADQAVLVTGGAGAVGGRLCHRLAEAGARVIVVDNLCAGVRWNLPASIHQFVEGDILDEPVLERAFAFRPRLVFHLASFFANENSVEHPERDLAVNGFGTLRLLAWAERRTVERVVYASSSCVYGAQASIAMSEPSASFHPQTPYQATKLLGELYANYFHGRGGLQVVSLRLFNAFGPGELPGPYRNVIPRFAHAALANEPIRLHGGGEDTRDFTYVDDIVEGMLESAIRAEAAGETINLGSGREVKILDLATLIVALTGSRSPLVVEDRRPWDRVARRRADLTKARRLLGYEPRWSLEAGLQETLRWFVVNQRRIARAVSAQRADSSKLLVPGAETPP
ncbi:MAG: NAD-dependent epimerase/dehydratase family protein [Candidatus Rokuibacteriota bacterium]